jgi:hypothetical protein
MFHDTLMGPLNTKGLKNFFLSSCIVSLWLFAAFSTAARSEVPQWISFEDDETGPFYGFTPEDRGGSYGMTADIDRDATPALFSHYSAYLSDSWERVSLPIGITEGLVHVWFYDDNYGGGTPGTQTGANAIRLRSEADDPEKDPGWPLHYLCVDLKGEYTGHGREGFLEYYTVARNGVAGVDMGVDFGAPVGSASDEIYRATESWHLVTFDMDNGTTSVSVDGEMVDIVETNPLSSLELLCRSGWYPTRPGEAQIMRWDGIAVSPKRQSTDFSSEPEWMTFDVGSSLVFDTTRSGQTAPFDFIPGSSRLARFPTGEQRMFCPWEVEEGAIEIWFWDDMADEGGGPDNGNIDIIVSSADTPTDYVRMRTYESVMGSPAGQWYLVTPQSPSGMGGSYNLDRKTGWNKLVFHKTLDCLYVSLNGQLVTLVDYRWDSPPEDLQLEISTRSGYNDGFPLWLGRIMLTGSTTSAVDDWQLYR